MIFNFSLQVPVYCMRCFINIFLYVSGMTILNFFCDNGGNFGAEIYHFKDCDKDICMMVIAVIECLISGNCIYGNNYSS